MKYPPTNFIQAYGLADAWGQAVNFVMKHGMEIKTEYGPMSKDICCVTEIREPYREPMLHPQFPTKEMHVKEYVKQWERDYDWKKQGFEYNYMDRLINYPSRNESVDVQSYASGEREGVWQTCHTPKQSTAKARAGIDQIKAIRELLPKGVSRRRQGITWIPERDLFVEEDQPCLQRLWFRNLGDNNIEMHCMWRSRDLYTAWNSNMVGLLTMVRKEILEPGNFELVKVVDFCNSMHIYESDWEAASKVKPIPKSPQMMLF